MRFRIDNSRSISGGKSQRTSPLRFLGLIIGVMVFGGALMSGCAGPSNDVQPSKVNSTAVPEKKSKALTTAFGKWADKLKRKQPQSSTPETDQQTIERSSSQPANAPVNEIKSEIVRETSAEKTRGIEARKNRGSLMTVRLPNGMYVTKRVVSLREARFEGVIAQKYDLSCGAAALATILNYYYDQPIEELDIIKYMLEYGDTHEIKQKGFSLLDLKKYALDHGYMAEGYRVGFDKLRKLKIPVIILFKSGSFSHFIVLKGISGDNAYIADPAYGNRSMALEIFEENWNGVIFVVATKNMQRHDPLQMETTLPAPVLQAMRVKDLFSTGFAGFISGEF